MEDTTEYWRIMDYPPFFSNIDWNENQSASTFIPMGFDQQKIPPSYQNPPPFQRRRSSSVDLPINPLYLNSNKFIFGNADNTIHEEEHVPSKVGSSATLEFPSNTNNNNNDKNHSPQTNGPNKLTLPSQSPSLSTCSSTNNDEHMISPPLSHHGPLAPNQPMKKPIEKPVSPKKSPTPPESMTTTFFPELHRTSYNTILGKQLRQHQKRRRSSSLPPAFHATNKHVNTNKGPTPLIFTQIQVTDPTPIQHTQKAAKVDARPIAIERVPKKPQVTKPMDIDPVETQRKLDEQLLQLNFEDVTVAELKEMLKERGLSSTGKKAVLLDRLKEARDQLHRNHSLWSKRPSDELSTNASPAIQGIADMSIHSPAVPVKMSFSPVVHPVDTQQNKLTPSDSPQDYNYQPLQPTMDTNDFNDLFDFDTILDGNAILFPSTNQQQQSSPHQPQPQDWDINWDQDKLDHFLTELV
ncbi:uncharacterized protein B0P05DRAFT_133841 [Gilbertella persicaria]|uniref:SAP domain-containing protein n=1 Tax=Rhizopus stolonifer TaxID=4846 RepID=A0A367JI85_RHIST|nr:uncharacterized protein B0P05DRAFT_133841 [Gilbertella persicaria]KAI8076626.1 hypothetical protein B0P05DRAFT_133841 [Gilbertella persicaria]RCH89653.1 hypothetical protein CU098_008755 [Rhizopus stolonifer]